jgi:hypothetical protein
MADIFNAFEYVAVRESGGSGKRDSDPLSDNT